MENTSASDPVLETLTTLCATDLTMLIRLVEQSNWNQTAHDWQVFAKLGRIHVIRNHEQTIVASGAVLPLDNSAAWISMILVAPDQQGRGMGRAVFEGCLADIRQMNRVALLDATPAGEALYAQYGFATQWHLRRWHRPARVTASPHSAPATGVNVEHHPEAVPTLATMDAQALGIARESLLDDLAGRPGSCMARSANAIGIVRDGRFARHIGPLLATSEQAAAQLLHHICSTESAAMLIDVPEARRELHIQLESIGFSPQRGFARMTLGDPVPSGLTAFIHAIAGPEYG